MTDADWSFSLRSATGFSGDAESGDENEGNVGDTRTSSHLFSGSQALQQIDLAAREDRAQYKPNPWSIAKVNAASRPRQPNATVKPVLEKPAAKKHPQGAIVDAFEKRVQKPKTTTKSSAQASRLQSSSRKPALTSAIGPSNHPASAPVLSPVSVAHITTSVADLVPVSSRSRTPQQHQKTQPPPFLSKRAFLTPCSGQKTNSAPNLQFTPRLKRVQPSSSPVRPHPQYRAPSTPGPPPKPPASFEPHTFEISTPSEAQIAIDNVTPTTSACKEDGCVIQSTQLDRHSTPVEPGSKVIPPYSRQNIRESRPRPGQPTVEAHEKSDIIFPSPFAQARRFFEYGPPPVPAIKRPPPNPEPPEEGPPSPPLSYPVTTSPPRKRIDPYDQLLSSPDSEWSTLKPPTRKNVTSSGKGKSKPPEFKSEKFRLPLTMASLAPPKEPPQKKPRVITYLPPPPPKKRKTVLEHPLATEDVEIGTAFQNPRTRMNGLPSPPPSDETAPPSSPTPSVRFDSNGVFTRYKLVRAKIRQRKALDVQLWDILGLESCGVAYRDPKYTPGGIDTWNGEIAFVTWHPRRSD